MEALNTTLSAAARRQAEIDRLIAETQAELDRRKKSRQRVNGGTGRGRMSGSEQAKENRLNAKLSRLRAGYLPGEVMSTARAPVEQVAQSARQNVQHHAPRLHVPSGQTAAANPSASSSSRGGSGAGNNTSGGSAAGGGSGSAGAADDDPDDDLPDAAFAQYYRVTQQQREFNLRAEGCRLKNRRLRKEQVKQQSAMLEEGRNESVRKLQTHRRLAYLEGFAGLSVCSRRVALVGRLRLHPSVTYIIYSPYIEYASGMSASLGDTRELKQ